MAVWTFIGTVFSAVLLLAFFVGRSRTVAARKDQDFDSDKHRRHVDTVALDAARTAGLPSGGYPF